MEGRQQGEERKNEKLPKVALPCPYRVALEPGRSYRYCTCGLSKSQPFCDESHVGTGFEPIEFSVDVRQKLWYLCGCKHNCPKAGPFCDGSHIKADW